MEPNELTLEQVMAALNPAEQESAKLLYSEWGRTPQEIQEFFNSL